MDNNSMELWRQQKIKQRSIFTARQRLPYEVKIRRQALRAWEFYEKMLSQGRDCHVSVGGLDKPCSIYGLFVDAWMPLPERYKEE